MRADVWRTWGTVLVIGLLWLLLWRLEPVFLTKQNLTAVLLQWSTLTILASGLTIVLIAGEVDLSIGSVQAFAGIIAAWTLIVHDWWLVPGIAAALGAAAGVGVLCAAVARGLRAPTFVVTLAALGIVHGATLFISESRSISLFPSDFTWLGQGRLLGVEVPIVLAVAVVALLSLLLHQTRFGVSVYAIGGHRDAAARSGIPVGAVILVAFALSTGLAGLAGIIESARVDSANADLGVTQLLDAIAAIVIGGTSLLGGRGSVVGTALGALVIASVRNGLVLLQIDASWQPIVIGTITLVAVMVDQAVRGETGRVLPRRRHAPVALREAGP
jgi:ribose/xylose/arabinose/galactoside ABC-type transport system permease subunit